MKFNNSTSLFSEIKTIPAILDQKTYPSLNGLRAVSILMVLAYHFMLNYHHYNETLAYLGPLGVDIFFVISGFLITTLCIKEKVTTGNLSLKKFYMRRALRILPVAYLYILVIAALSYFFNLHVSAISFISSAFFLANISYFWQQGYNWNLAHYWSLSVEEQFYILLPVFIKQKFSLYVAILLVLALLTPLLVYAQTLIGFMNTGIITAALHYLVKFQGIAIGCLFSVLLFKGYLNLGRFKFAVTLLAIFMIFFLRFDALYGVKSCFVNFVISTFVGFIIVNNISLQSNFVYRFLNIKALGFIGILSYSIYIWQQLFLSNDTRFPLSKYPINLLLLALVPVLSYFYYEKYFLKLKKRFIKTKNV